MSKIIQFYTNLFQVDGYYLDDIIKWDDYNIESMPDFIQWLFPNIKDLDINLSRKSIHQFKTDVSIRDNVIQVVIRMLLFYGFVLDKEEIIKQIKPIYRRDKGETVGLLSKRNYNRITRIMDFLNIIEMQYLSAIFFLLICTSMKTSKIFSKQVLKNEYLKHWMSTQSFLVSYIQVDKPIKMETECKNIKGLNYTGNSCYMDSTLICTFIIPNEVITNNILKKDMNMLKTINRRLWSKCGNNINIDIKNRQGIQKALNEITLSIRGLNNVNNCTNLRSLIKKCPGSQPFHERGTQDAGEFLAYLFNLFQVDVATTSRKTYASNDFDYESKWVLTSKNIDEYSSPIIDIVSTTILDIESGYNITNFLTQTEDSVLEDDDIWTPNKNKPLETYIRRKEVFKIKKSPFIVFNLSRTYVTRNKRSKSLKEYNTWKLISAPEDLLLNGKNLKLSAIVVHTGGAHYVANFKCNDQWFWYDDNPSSSKHIIKNIGSYNNMLKTSPNPLSHGTLFFYT